MTTEQTWKEVSALASRGLELCKRYESLLDREEEHLEKIRSGEVKVSLGTAAGMLYRLIKN